MKELPSCLKKYGCLFSPELVEHFNYDKRPPQYIMAILEEQCEDLKCKHHLLNGEWPSANPNAPLAQQCFQCKCLLGLVEDEAKTGPQIAEMLGISKQRVNQYEQAGLEKMQVVLLKEGGDKEFYLSGKQNSIPKI
jgi:hypothetical protein